MPKQVGTVKIQLSSGLTEVPAFKIGRYWAVNSAGDTSPYFNVTHINTGQKIVGYIGIRRASKMVGVLDVLFPTELESEMSQKWRTLPYSVQCALVEP